MGARLLSSSNWRWEWDEGMGSVATMGAVPGMGAWLQIEHHLEMVPKNGAMTHDGSMA